MNKHTVVMLKWCHVGKFLPKAHPSLQPNAPDIPCVAAHHPHTLYFFYSILFMCKVQLGFYLRPDKSFSPYAAEVALHQIEITRSE